MVICILEIKCRRYLPNVVGARLSSKKEPDIIGVKDEILKEDDPVHID